MISKKKKERKKEKKKDVRIKRCNILINFQKTPEIYLKSEPKI